MPAAVNGLDAAADQLKKVCTDGEAFTRAEYDNDPMYEVGCPTNLGRFIVVTKRARFMPPAADNNTRLAKGYSERFKAVASETITSARSISDGAQDTRTGNASLFTMSVMTVREITR